MAIATLFAWLALAAPAPGQAPRPPLEAGWQHEPVYGRLDSILLTDGTMFELAARRPDGPLWIRAADPYTNALRWEREGPTGFADSAQDAGRLLVLWDDGESETDDLVQAYDAGSGQPLWSARLRAVASSQIGSANGVVYVSTATAVHAFDAATGAVRWEARVGPARMRLSDDGLFVVTGSEVVALDPATGAERWRIAPEGVDYGRPVMATTPGRLWLRGAQGRLVLDAATGATLRQDPSLAVPLSGALLEYRDGSLHAYDPDSLALRWATPVEAPWDIHVHDDTVYVTSEAGRLHVLGLQDGAYLGSLEPQPTFGFSREIMGAGSGVVLLWSYDTLFGVRTVVPRPAEPLAPGGGSPMPAGSGAGSGPGSGPGAGAGAGAGGGSASTPRLVVPARARSATLRRRGLLVRATGLPAGRARVVLPGVRRTRTVAADGRLAVRLRVPARALRRRVLTVTVVPARGRDLRARVRLVR